MNSSSWRRALASLAALSILAGTAADEAPVAVETLLKTTGSWDGRGYDRYPAGTPEISVLKVTVPPRTELSWHTHPMISAVYLVSGTLNLNIKETGRSISFKAGDVFGDTVDVLHRGYTEDAPAEMIVFFAGTPGMPLRQSPRAEQQ